LEAGLLGRAVFCEGGDVSSRRYFEVAFIYQLPVHCGDRHTEPSALYYTVFDEVLNDLAHDIRGDSEAVSGISSRGACNRCIYPYKAALQIDEGTTAVTRVDR